MPTEGSLGRSQNLGPPRTSIATLVLIHDLHDVDPDRLMAKFIKRCACPDPRFDQVTAAGERHSELCCSCGRPGPNDHVG